MNIHSLRTLGNFWGNSLNIDQLVTGFCVDTRLLKSGNIYFALPGNRVDGHSFVTEAFQKGASGAVVHQSFKKTLGRCIYVPDVLKALQELAKVLLATHRPRYVIAVTGSLGKTTTKEFIATLLASQYSVFKSPGNYNSQVGLPLALLNYWRQEEVIILEMGMTHAGQLTQLIDIAPPDISVLTKVGLVHAENFNSLEEIGYAKAEIFKHPQTQFGIYAHEIENLLSLKHFGSCSKKTFALEDPLADFAFFHQNAWMFKAIKDQHELNTLPFQEPHILHNLLAAFSVASILKVPLDLMKSQLSQLQLPERRWQRIEKQGVIFINDAYNAAEDSIRAALESMPMVAKGNKRIGIFGSMLELGKFSEACHRRIGETALLILDHLICLGEECWPMVEVWKSQNRSVDFFSDHEAVIACLRKLLKPGDHVLIKGSRSKMMWKIVDEY